MKHRYLLGSGYVPTSKTPVPAHVFANIWRDNNHKHCNPAPVKTVVLGGSPFHSSCANTKGEVLCIDLQGNLGHIRDKHEGRKSHALVGWSATMLALALIAYSDELDFIYKEQDCLAFGPWVEQLYEDCGAGYMTVGQPLKAHPKLKACQSLFLVRHAYIPTFVHGYLDLGEDCNSNFPENKFAVMQGKDPDNISVMSFGFDRDRPLPYNDRRNPWYAQQWTTEEFDHALKLGII